MRLWPRPFGFSFALPGSKNGDEVGSVTERWTEVNRIEHGVQDWLFKSSLSAITVGIP